MPPKKAPFSSRDERALSRHILPSSGTMFGICITFVGLVKVVETRAGPSHVDEYAALASLPFLVSAFVSYMSIRHVECPRFSARCEAVADKAFLFGLVGIAIIALLFAYEVI